VRRRGGDRGGLVRGLVGGEDGLLLVFVVVGGRRSGEDLFDVTRQYGDATAEEIESRT
jgi:hypothetical protein